MIKVALVRGKYLNNFEGQNYIFPPDKINLTAISSLIPLHKKFPFPVIRLPSLADLGMIKAIERLIKIIANRTLGDSQILFGLEKYASKFDLFHTADPHYYYSYQLARLRANNLIKKLIVTSWETIPFNNEGTRKKAAIKKFTQRFTDMFICYTEKARKALMTEGIDEDKIIVVRLGVDLNKFKVQNLKFKIEKKQTTILFVGRLVEEKGIMDLYEGYKKIQNSKFKTQNYNLNLKIVGDGYLKKKLRKKINRDRLNNFCSIEQKSYEEMPQVYRDSDVLVVPSKTTKTWEEQYGMVLIEAMASGLPIVAYDSGAISEVLGGVGLLVREGDVNELAKAIVQLIENKNLRIKLGKMGRERVEKEFDPKKTARKIGEIYRNILEINRDLLRFIEINRYYEIIGSSFN